MVMLSNGLSSALFKRFTNDKFIPGKIFLFNIIWIIVSAAVLYFASGIVITVLFGIGFDTVREYVLPLSVAYILKTLCQPFSFLMAKGMGKEMRNVSFAEGIISVITNLAFVPLWGVMGAIYASILARAADLIGLYYYYRKYLKENN
jgi:O-antigen/teichoic acid export membrane protein